jgi:NAD+-dependent protein deacetylase SIR2
LLFCFGKVADRPDLVLIIGTSLVVYPFAALPEYTRPSVPRVVMNFDALENFERPNDVYIAGDCDQTIWSLCEKLGWLDELQALHKQVDGVEPKLGAEKKSEAEETVDKLAKELAEELKLDKEEDVEIRRIKDKQGPVLSDGDTVVVTQKDAESVEPEEATGKVKSEDSKAQGSEVEAKSEEAKGANNVDTSESDTKTPSDPKTKL